MSKESDIDVKRFPQSAVEQCQDAMHSIIVAVVLVTIAAYSIVFYVVRGRHGH